MQRSIKPLLVAACSLMLATAACLPTPQPPATPTATPPSIPTDPPNAIPTIDTATTVPINLPTPTPAGPFGPTGFPPNVNPLTGLVVSDPAVLNRRPILIKVSNESPDVRPYSGLSFADHVWEYQMEGWALTRYTAVFLSQTPDFVGSLRSARLIDLEQLVPMYGGILVNSGASTNKRAGGPPRVNELLFAQPWKDRVINADWGFGEPYQFRQPDIPHPGVAYHHTLFARPEEIWKYADQKGFNQRPNLDGLVFDWNIPVGGTPTTEVAIDYSGRGPKRIFRWDAGESKWLNFIEDQNRRVPEAQEGDYLTGQPLVFDNVVIIWAYHYDADYIEDEPAQLPGVHVDLSGEGDAELFRDGMRYLIKWRRVGTEGMLQFFTLNGQPIAFKPGTTWFNTASYNAAKPVVTYLP